MFVLLRHLCLHFIWLAFLLSEDLQAPALMGNKSQLIADALPLTRDAVQMIMVTGLCLTLPFAEIIGHEMAALTFQQARWCVLSTAGSVPNTVTLMPGLSGVAKPLMETGKSTGQGER